jgi:hypothetical protein
MGHCRVRVRYTWYGPGGDSVASTVVAEAMDSGDKSSPKAMSVAYRTAILQTLALPTDDPEPDAQTYQRSRRQADREAPPRRAQQGMGTDRGSCPYYMTRGLPDAQRGECSFGCRDEPVCITSEPEGGWPAAYDANDPAKIKRRMFALFRDAGVGTAREDRIQFCRIATGRDSINSSDDLTAAEVAMVIKALEAGIAEPKEAAS